MWKTGSKRDGILSVLRSEKRRRSLDETEDVLREKADQAVEFVKRKNNTGNGYSCREDRRCSRDSCGKNRGRSRKN